MEVPNLPSPERPALSQSSIVFLRLLLLFLAAGAVVAALAVAFRRPADAAVRYACPMHADVRSKAPSSCPICGMALEPIGRDANGDGQHRTASIPDMIAFENVRKHKIMGFVRTRSLTPNLQEIRDPSWATSDSEISAILYNDQIEALSAEEPGSFSPTALPKTSVGVTRIAGPAMPWDRSTSLVRFRIDASKGAKSSNPIQAGQVGWLQLAPRARTIVSVPVSAVLQEPDGPYVLAWAGGDKLEKRRIEIGEYFAAQGFAVVLSGLRHNDHVVARATFFVDADRRLGRGDQPMWSAP